MRVSHLLASLALQALVLSSCAPQAFVVSSQMRAPSKSGLSLFGKSIAVVYLEEGDAAEPSPSSSLTGGFVSRLEEDYFDGEETIETFRMTYSPQADYTSKDSLVNLVMDTGKDVVFLFDNPLIGEPTVSQPIPVQGLKPRPDSSHISSVSFPFTTRVYVYDSMNKNDKVLAFSGSKEITQAVYTDGSTPTAEIASQAVRSAQAQTESAGYQAAASFLSTWKEERLMVIYYDGAERAWDEGAKKAYSHQWKEAIEQWMLLLKSGNAEKRACASYNIALGCFLMGQPALALEWLDRSDKDKPVSLSSVLRAKINEYAGL